MTASLIKERVFLYGGEDDINPESAGPEIYDLETRVCQVFFNEQFVKNNLKIGYPGDIISIIIEFIQ